MIRTEGITKAYGDLKVLKGINIDINDQNNIIDEINQLGESFGLNDNKENLKDKNNLTDVLSIKIENWKAELEFCDNESERKAIELLIKINVSKSRIN